MTEAAALVDRVIQAKAPIELFGAEELYTGQAGPRALQREFRRLAKAVHPDRNGGDPRFETAFAKLNQLYQQAQAELEAGAYGHARLVRFTHRGADIAVQSAVLWEGDSSTYHSGTRQAAGSAEAEVVVLKLAKSPKENTALANEARTLQALAADKEVRRKSGFFPQLISHARLRPGGGPARTGLLLRRPWLQLYDFCAVKAAYPKGVAARDLAWMLRRVLYALGLAHRAGVLHAAVLPQHILVEPDQHGIVLCDWKHSVKPGARVRAVPRGKRWAYPPEVGEGRPATPALDIWMGVAAVLYLAGPEWVSRLPRPLRAFFRGCLHESPALRPQDAWDLLGEFDDLLGRMWGPRRFHPFTMP